MPVMKRSFQEMNPVTLGIAGVLVVVAMLALAINSGPLYRSFTSSTYTADFAEAGNLQSGDQVRVGGVKVGQVSSVGLDHAHVRVEFTVDDGTHFGRDTRAAIATATPLGKKFVNLIPSGPGQLSSGSEIPLSRTNSPYDIADDLATLTTLSSDIDKTQLATALNTLATTFRNTPGDLKSALSGVSRLSDTISSRDDELQQLLANAQSVTGLLASRKDQITTLLGDGNLLLSTLYQRRDELHSLLVSATDVVQQLRGLVDDNHQTLAPALQQLQGVLDLLNSNQKNLSNAIVGLQAYAGGLGDAVGSGPFFYAFVQNLPPTNIVPMLPELLEKKTK